jgi:hypothetical protein
MAAGPFAYASIGTTVGVDRDSASRSFGIGHLRSRGAADITFLGINGLDFDAPEPDVVTRILMLADGSLSEKQLAEWIRSHTDARCR